MVLSFGRKAKLSDPLNVELASFVKDFVVAGGNESQMSRLGARISVFFEKWGISSERDRRNRIKNSIAFVEAQFGKTESLEDLKRHILDSSAFYTVEQTTRKVVSTPFAGFDSSTPFVFLSYARLDRELVLLLRECLFASGIAAWVDADIETGDCWSTELQAKLEAAFAVLVLWTVNSRASDWVNREADFARSNDKLFQTQVGYDRAPPRFRDQQIADLTNWTGGVDEPEWISLENVLKSRLAAISK